MSEVKVNKITPTADCGTVTLGDSGDTVAIPAGVTLTSGGALQNSGTITNTGSITGVAITGTIDNQVNWQTTVKTTGFTATAGEGYFCNTTSGAFTVTLPASPSAGDLVGIKDYANTADTNNITIGRNGSNIEGVANDFLITVEGGSITLIYVDATKGWLSTAAAKASDISENATFITATGGNAIVTCGDFKTHIFTGPGTFCVSSLGNPGGGPNSASYLVVAGGGGSNYGAGGAGGFRQSVTCAGTIPLSVSGFPITVGAGGAGTPSGCASRGSVSTFSTITSAGGGASGQATPASTSSTNAPGGSGAGAPGYDFPAPSPGSPGSTTHQNGGAGNQPPVSPPQGNAGGRGHGTYGTSDNGSGGGGGAGSGAADTSVGTPGGTPGGAGAPSTILGSTPTAPSYGESGPSPGRYFAGGGAGSQQNPGAKSGGVGGGGDAPGAGGTGVDGATNMGGGGGARRGSGGSGIVMIRYKFQ